MYVTYYVNGGYKIDFYTKLAICLEDLPFAWI
jgi:hypothetical protein